MPISSCDGVDLCVLQIDVNQRHVCYIHMYYLKIDRRSSSHIFGDQAEH